MKITKRINGIDVRKIFYIQTKGSVFGKLDNIVTHKHPFSYVYKIFVSINKSYQLLFNRTIIIIILFLIKDNCCKDNLRRFFFKYLCFYLFIFI